MLCARDIVGFARREFIEDDHPRAGESCDLQFKCSSLVLIERGQNHEIRNVGTTNLKTLNFYVPPAYTKAADELPPGKSQ
jgi:oxalate decarboxylase/phosphoglucose isomerase-like protein (cupin superfamily)